MASSISAKGELDVKDQVSVKNQVSMKDKMTVPPQKTSLLNQESFNETLREYEGAILRVVSNYERIKARQEELYQEICLAIWKALAKFDHKSSLKTYLLSIAHKRSISHVAKYANEPKSSDITEMALDSKEQHSSAAGRLDLNQELEKHQRITKLLQAMDQLPLVERQLVSLALEGVSYKDIAEILGITVTNVGAKLNRAKAKLKTLIESGEITK